MATEADVKPIAFYLPQYHPVPENDEWWGRGFTEWSNVAKAIPEFIGHYQPKLPGELGFYDLRIREVQRRQVELAKQYGLYGFCFYFYWFGGKRLLEMPLEQFCADTKINFPFCICWANENWTRQWDGMNEDVLIGQEHSPEDDIAFIEHISNYLKDDRYIRIDSKPLFIIYRPALLPEPKKTAERWREWCNKNGIGDIYLAFTHSFEHLDPREIGFDASIEFAPNTFILKDITSHFYIVNNNFNGRIFDYTSAIDLAREYITPPYIKFRCLCPGWDNAARKPGRGVTLANATPDFYKEWLRILYEYTIKHFVKEERFIFINAWNEWAEGAYLEPDRKFGYAYLEATAEVLRINNIPEGSDAKFETGNLEVDNLDKVIMRLAEKDSAIAEKDSAIAEKDNTIAEKDNAIAEKNNAIAERDGIITDKDNLIAGLEMKRIELESVLNSKSWKLTYPLRWISARVKGMK